MSHLTLEALARLVDEAPDSREMAHLASCTECRTELDALRDLSETLATLPTIMPPPDAWPALRERLREERLIKGAPRRRPGPAMLRAAAAAGLFLAGGAVGWGVRGPTAAPPRALAEAGTNAGPTTSQSAYDTDFAEPFGTMAGRAEGQETVAGPAEAVDRDALAIPVSNPVAPPAADAETAFFAAHERNMQTTSAEPGDPATRLATLDHMVLTAAEALNEAPTDPMINGYYLTFVAQRNAYLRHLAASTEPIF